MTSREAQIVAEFAAIHFVIDRMIYRLRQVEGFPMSDLLSDLEGIRDDVRTTAPANAQEPFGEIMTAMIGSVQFALEDWG